MQKKNKKEQKRENIFGKPEGGEVQIRWQKNKKTNSVKEI